MLFDQCRPGIEATFEELIRNRIKCKVNFCIRILFQKINFRDGTVAEEDRGYMSVDAVVVETASDLDYAIENSQANLDAKIDAYTNRGSNWIVGAIEELTLSLVAFK